MNNKNLLLILILLGFNSLLNAQKQRLIISANTVMCQAGEVKTECMLVKYKKNQKDWQYFYDNINGFKYIKGNEYNIMVKIEKVLNPPADGSSLKYTLIKLISRRKIKNASVSKPEVGPFLETTPSLQLHNTQWVIEYFNNPKKDLLSKKSYFTINNINNSFSGNDGCNDINGIIITTNNSIQFKNIASSKMMCPEIEQANMFTKNLLQVDKFEIRGAELLLYNKDLLIMTLESFK